MKTKTKQVALTSTSMIHAPGILAWAINGAKFKKDRAKMVKVMQSWPGLTVKEWEGVLDGTIPHTVEGDKVLITLNR